MAQATFRRSIPLQDGSTIRTTYDKASKMYDITRVSPTGKELDSDAVDRDYVKIAQDATIHSSKKGALAAIHLAFENRRRSALSA